MKDYHIKVGPSLQPNLIVALKPNLAEFAIGEIHFRVRLHEFF